MVQGEKIFLQAAISKFFSSFSGRKFPKISEMRFIGSSAKSWGAQSERLRNFFLLVRDTQLRTGCSELHACFLAFGSPGFQMIALFIVEAILVS